MGKYNNNIELNTAVLPLLKVNTLEQCKKAVMINGFYIKYVPDEFKNDVYKYAIDQNYQSLYYIKKKLPDELYILAVKQNYLAIKFIKIKYITNDILLAAVKADIRALKYTDDENLIIEGVREFYIYLYTHEGRYKKSFYIDYYDYLRAKNLFTFNIFKYIKNPTTEIYIHAVKCNPVILKHIPKENHNTELYTEALRHTGKTLKYVELSSDYNFLIVRRYGYAIKYIDEQSEELCNMAMRQDYNNIKYIKNPNSKMKEYALSKNGLLLQFINDPSDKEICISLKQNGMAIIHVKDPTMNHFSISMDAELFSDEKINIKVGDPKRLKYFILG